MQQPLAAAAGPGRAVERLDGGRAGGCGSHDGVQRIVYEVMSGGAVSGSTADNTVPERTWTHRCGTVVEISIIVVIILNVGYVMLDAEEISQDGWDGSMDQKQPKTLDEFMDYFVAFVRLFPLLRNALCI